MESRGGVTTPGKDTRKVSRLVLIKTLRQGRSIKEIVEKAKSRGPRTGLTGISLFREQNEPTMLKRLVKEENLK